MRTIESTKIDATSDGVNTIISGRAGQRIVVVNYAVVADAAGQITFNAEDDSDYAVFDLATNGGVSFSGTVDAPAFECKVGDDLEITTQTGQDVGGHIGFYYRAAR